MKTLGFVLSILLVCAAAGAVPAFAATTFAWTDNGDGRAHLWPGVSEPSYERSLAIEYESATGASGTLEQWAADGITATVWMTSDLGGGRHALRWRWVADGAPGPWSEAETLRVTDAPLPTTASLSWDDPILNRRGRIAVTLEDAATGGPVSFGRFVDGEPYVVAPDGIRITAERPARATPEVRGRRYVLNGSMVDGDVAVQALIRQSGIERTYEPAKAYRPGDVVQPGSVYMKSSAQDSPDRRDNLELIGTITVLSQRPPARAFRPAPHASATKRMPVEAQRDLSLVPRFPATSIFFDPAEADVFRKATLQLPAPPLGGGSAQSRALFPENAASQYHRTIRQDWGVASWYILSSNLDDSVTVLGPDGIARSRRELMANALFQRMIDHIGGAESARAANHSPVYHWASASALAGTIFRDEVVRNAHHRNMVRRDYMFSRGPGPHNASLVSWAEAEAERGKYDPDKPAAAQRLRIRDLDFAGSDWGAGDVIAWDALLAPRTVAFPSDHPKAGDLEALGIRNNGDDTWTIPADRDAIGMTVWYTRSKYGFPQGDAFLLDVGPGDWRVAEDGSATVPEPLLNPAIVQKRWSDENFLSPPPDVENPGPPDAEAYYAGNTAAITKRPRYGRPVVSGAEQTGRTLRISGLKREPRRGDWFTLGGTRKQPGHHGAYRIEEMAYDPAAGTALLTLDTALASSPPDGGKVDFMARYADNPHYSYGRVKRGQVRQANWWARGFLSRMAAFGKVRGTDAVPSGTARADKIGDVVYVWQHGTQVPFFAPILRALPSKAYLHPDPDEIAKYETFADEWMRRPSDWVLAAGFFASRAYPEGGTAIAGARGSGDAMYAAPDNWRWVDDIWRSAFDDTAPAFEAAAPDAMRAQDVSLHVPDPSVAEARIVLRNLPHDGYAPILRVEASVNGGPFEPLRMRRPGQAVTVPITPGRNEIQLRAVNPVGSGPARRYVVTF